MNQLFPNFGTPHESQRGYFSAQLYEEMTKNKDIWLLLGDLGYKVFDKHREKWPERVINCGAAEFSMVGVACGLALKGKIPVVYSTTPFLLYRPMEMIRNYINHEKIPVKLIGSGRDRDYGDNGFSHYSEEDCDIMNVFTNIISLWPLSKDEIPCIVKKILYNKCPTYLNLQR
jgi:transketolase